MSEELKPCPFCHAEAKWRPVEDGVFNVPFGVVAIHTDECWFNSFSAAFEDLPAIWNTRASIGQEHSSEVERLRELLAAAREALTEYACHAGPDVRCLRAPHQCRQECGQKAGNAIVLIDAALNGGQHE